MSEIVMHCDSERLRETKTEKCEPNSHKHTHTHIYLDIWGPFVKFAGSPYYSESEICGGAVTVYFSKYLPWQAMYFLQRFTHFSKMCCRPLSTLKFLTSDLPFHGWKSPRNRMRQDLDCMVDVLMGFHKSIFFFQAEHKIQFRSHSMQFLGFSNHEKGALRQEISKWSMICSMFLRSGWSVVRSASLAKGGT
jgi:hypothetical protein